MSTQSNHRRLERTEVQQPIVVLDVLNELEVGRLVNIHEEGFMVIGARSIKENCLYQLVFMLTEPIQGRCEIHVGAECLWIKETGGGDQYWAGFHIMDLADEDLAAIKVIGNTV